METVSAPKPARYGLLDTLRGAALCSMIVYHALWDAVNLFGLNCPWYGGAIGFVWQQSICWTFILLSGFCWPLGRHPFRQGMITFGAGALVTVATLLFSYEDRVLFGVLTLLGTMMLLLIVLDKALRHIPPLLGFAFSAAFFALLRDVNSGYLGFAGWHLAKLPQGLYQGWGAAFLGFQPAFFFSTDYFSLLPWGFLFLAGYFLGRWVLSNAGQKSEKILSFSIRPLAFLGRHSLLIYLAHQPLIYGAMLLVFAAVLAQ